MWFYSCSGQDVMLWLLSQSLDCTLLWLERATDWVTTDGVKGTCKIQDAPCLLGKGTWPHHGLEYWHVYLLLLRYFLLAENFTHHAFGLYVLHKVDGFLSFFCKRQKIPMFLSSWSDVQFVGSTSYPVGIPTPSSLSQVQKSGFEASIQYTATTLLSFWTWGNFAVTVNQDLELQTAQALWLVSCNVQTCGQLSLALFSSTTSGRHQR